MLTVTPTKLQNGSWGVWLTRDQSYKISQEMTGTRVTVKTKSGKTWETELDDVVKEYNSGFKMSTRKITGSMTSTEGSSPSTARRKPLRGIHTDHHCGCGNWGGPGTPCLYSYGEAKAEGESRYIEWVR